ncbi:MAG: LapA family protein [Candidatus Nanopelagicales bacterium]|nr:LapA family protein [Candidatus Nanopelagicales bacterium]MDZ4250544.1 LapA family protein [Candidatus Nanopelagicales bacterium]
MNTSREAREGKPSVPGRPEPVDVAKYARVFGWLILAILAILFVILNSGTVSVSLVFAQRDVPLFVALLIAMALGAGLGSGTGWWLRRRRTRRNAGKAAPPGSAGEADKTEKGEKHPK